MIDETKKPASPAQSLADNSKIIGAAQTLAAQNWYQVVASGSQKKITPNEWTSLSAMIVYAAHKSGTYEFKVARDMADYFNIPNVSCLPAARYDEAMRYLTDIIDPAEGE